MRSRWRVTELCIGIEYCAPKSIHNWPNFEHNCLWSIDLLAWVMLCSSWQIPWTQTWLVSPWKMHLFLENTHINQVCRDHMPNYEFTIRNIKSGRTGWPSLFLCLCSMEGRGFFVLFCGFFCIICLQFFLFFPPSPWLTEGRIYLLFSLTGLGPMTWLGQWNVSGILYKTCTNPSIWSFKCACVV